MHDIALLLLSAVVMAVIIRQTNHDIKKEASRTSRKE